MLFYKAQGPSRSLPGIEPSPLQKMRATSRHALFKALEKPSLRVVSPFRLNSLFGWFQDGIPSQGSWCIPC